MITSATPGISYQGNQVPLTPATGKTWSVGFDFAPVFLPGFSLGATLFELLIGAPPFLDDDPNEILRMHLSDAPHDVRELRPELSGKTATLVKLMLAKAPNERRHRRV